MTTRTGSDHIHRLVRISDTYFRYQCTDPRCGRKLRIMSGVLVNGPKLQSGPEGLAVTCRWFLKCGQLATGTTPHSVLGDVPTCDRCHKFATGEVRNA